MIPNILDICRYCYSPLAGLRPNQRAHVKGERPCRFGEDGILLENMTMHIYIYIVEWTNIYIYTHTY